MLMRGSSAESVFAAALKLSALDSAALAAAAAGAAAAKKANAGSLLTLSTSGESSISTSDRTPLPSVRGHDDPVARFSVSADAPSLASPARDLPPALPRRNSFDVAPPLPLDLRPLASAPTSSATLVPPALQRQLQQQQHQSPSTAKQAPLGRSLVRMQSSEFTGSTAGAAAAAPASLELTAGGAPSRNSSPGDSVDGRHRKRSSNHTPAPASVDAASPPSLSASSKRVLAPVVEHADEEAAALKLSSSSIDKLDSSADGESRHRKRTGAHSFIVGSSSSGARVRTGRSRPSSRATSPTREPEPTTPQTPPSVPPRSRPPPPPPSLASSSASSS
jgi:hypothetical protein